MLLKFKDPLREMELETGIHDGGSLLLALVLLGIPTIAGTNSSSQIPYPSWFYACCLGPSPAKLTLCHCTQTWMAPLLLYPQANRASPRGQLDPHRAGCGSPA